MTDALNHAELSRELALALCYYPESVKVVKYHDALHVCKVWRIKHSTPGWESTEWMDFDYRAPSVVVPLIKWLLDAPRFIHISRWEAGHSEYRAIANWGEVAKADTLEEAVARAVIAVRKGE